MIEEEELHSSIIVIDVKKLPKRWNGQTGIQKEKLVQMFGKVMPSSGRFMVEKKKLYGSINDQIHSASIWKNDILEQK